MTFDFGEAAKNLHNLQKVGEALGLHGSVPAATQEQPAGSGASKPVRLEQPLGKLREIAGELNAAGQKATAKLIRQCVDEIIDLTLYEGPGSPRKVGEDGAIPPISVSMEDVIYRMRREADTVMSPPAMPHGKGWASAVRFWADEMERTLEALSRPSSVPVGEQK